MELRREQEKNHSIPNSITYHHHHHHPSSASAVSIPPETTRNGPSFFSPTNQTLDQPHLIHHHHGRHDNSDPDPPSSQAAASATTRYKECLKNHAASQGKHVVDGCGEFMPSGEEGTLEALRCAACDCHRNFHRKERNEDELQPPQNRAVSWPRPLTMPPHQQHYSHSPIMMNFGGRGGGGSGMAAESSSGEDLHVHQCEVLGGGSQLFSGSKKRFRTKFSQEQKERMHEFGEKLGWKIQKQDEQEVVQFCNDLGIKRQVFKVWMHNNKQAMKRKQQQM